MVIVSVYVTRMVRKLDLLGFQYVPAGSWRLGDNEVDQIGTVLDPFRFLLIAIYPVGFSGIVATYVRTLAVDSQSPGALYAVLGAPGSGGLYKTIDGGANWSRVPVSPHWPQLRILTF